MLTYSERVGRTRSANYAHVDDLVEGDYMLMQSDLEGPANIGSEERVTVDELAGFLIDGKVVVELKAPKGLTEVDEAQLLNYLKGTGLRVGLLFNFGTSSLQHVRRVL